MILINNGSYYLLIFAGFIFIAKSFNGLFNIELQDVNFDSLLKLLQKLQTLTPKN